MGYAKNAFCAIDVIQDHQIQTFKEYVNNVFYAEYATNVLQTPRSMEYVFNA
jgi:hypothetical protein